MPGDRSAKIEHRVFFLFVACFSIYFPDSLTDDFCFCFFADTFVNKTPSASPVFLYFQ
jgi:hypothetical protein